MTTEETVRDVLSRARQGFALVTWESRCYEPKKKDLGATRRTAETYGTDTGSVSVIKETVIDSSIKNIHSIRNKARNYHYEHTRPWAGRKVGIIRGQDLLEYVQTMNSFVKEFDAAVEEAASKWGLIIMAQQERLGDDLFKIEDYPTVGQFRGKFSMRYYVDQLPEKGDWLLDVPEDSITELAGSFDNQMEQRINELKCCVLDECAETMDHALQLLRKGGGSVRGALVANVRKTMGWLRDLNINDDHRILDIVKKIEAAVVNPGAAELRENERACADAERAVRSSLYDIRRLSEEVAS